MKCKVRRQLVSLSTPLVWPMLYTLLIQLHQEKRNEAKRQKPHNKSQELEYKFMVTHLLITVHFTNGGLPFLSESWELNCTLSLSIELARISGHLCSCAFLEFHAHGHMAEASREVTSGFADPKIPFFIYIFFLLFLYLKFLHLKTMICYIKYACC